MISKVVKHRALRECIAYLFEEEQHAHQDARVIAGWVDPARLEPGLRTTRDGRVVRDTSALVRELRAPVEVGHQPPEKFVWHLSLRNHESDRVLSDEEWAAVVTDAVRRTGIAPDGDPSGCRWVAVRHDEDHVHVVATLVRQDGRNAETHNDFHRLRETAADWEQRYGLTRTARGDRTAAVQPKRAEKERAAREGRTETPREQLRREVYEAAALATGPEGFEEALAAAGVAVHWRRSTLDPDQITGYSVSLAGNDDRAGEPVRFSGGKLAPDLTWPKLSAQWSATGPDRRPPGTVARELSADQEALLAEARRAVEGAAGLEDLVERAAGAGVTVRAVWAPDGTTLAGVTVAAPGGAPVSLARLDPALGGAALDEAFTVERERRALAEVVGRAADDSASAGEWEDELADYGVKVRYRTDAATGGRMGYSARFEGSTRWHAGGKLDGLTWGALNGHWHHDDDTATIRARLRAVAAESYTVDEFVTFADRAGVVVELRRNPAGAVVGYDAQAVLEDQDGQERRTARYSPAALGPELRWGALNRQLRRNREGLASVEERAEIYRSARAAMDGAARHLRVHGADSPAAGDVAAGTGALLSALASRLDGPQARALRDAADTYTRARMEPYGQQPDRDRRGEQLRTAARQFANLGRLSGRHDDAGVDVPQLVEAAGELVLAVAELRMAQDRHHQGEAAEAAALLLRGAAEHLDAEDQAALEDAAVALAVEADPAPDYGPDQGRGWTPPPSTPGPTLGH
jgi:hypothetical protein